MITLLENNDVYIRVDADRGIMMELSEYFSFFVKNHWFIPSVKRKQWDGRIRLLQPNGNLYKGLIPYIYKFAKDREYPIENTIVTRQIDFDEKLFFEQLNPYYNGKPITPYDHQVAATKHAIQKERCLLLSPTSSGKSFIIYSLLQWYLNEVIGRNQKLLIVVPTKNLCLQMYSDFEHYSEKYNFDTEENTHIIMGGKEKITEKPIIISTWQSIHRMGIPFFKEFGFVVIDEVHLATAKSLTSIMEKLIRCRYRFGTTGTLGEDCLANKLQLEGLTGSVYEVSTTKKLMDAGLVANLKIKSLVLQYSDEERKLLKKYKYAEEISWIIANKRRNKFIKNLSLSLNNNTLILFNFVTKHGQPLFKLIKESTDKKVYYVHGKTNADDREEIRKLAEMHNGIIIIASLGTLSTGWNVRNLQNIIFAHPSKGEVRNLQSIGRGLRLDGKSDKATLYDLADDLSWKKHQNYGMKHWMTRISIYNKEEFDYTITKVKI